MTDSSWSLPSVEGASHMFEQKTYGTIDDVEELTIAEPKVRFSTISTKRTLKDRKERLNSVEKGLGVLEASFSYIKGSLSSGYVTIPLSFAILGLIPSIIVGILIALANYYMMIQLDTIASDINTRDCNYTKLVKRVLGSNFSFAAKILQFLYCFGAALAELVFTISFIAGISCLFEWDSVCQSSNLQYAIVLFVITPLVTITKMYQLSYASLIATTIQIGFYIFIIFYLFADLGSSNFTKQQFSAAITSSNTYTVFQVFGVLMYTISNATNPLQVRKSLSKVTDFPKVLKIGCITTAVVGILLGCVGPFLNQTRKLNEIILMELPTSSSFILSTELLFVISITVNFLVFGFGVFEPLEQISQVRELILSEENKDIQFLKKYLLRMFFVCIIFILSVAIPNLTNLVSLVGSLNAGLLILVFPALMVLKHHRGSNNKRTTRFIAYFVLLVGICFTAAGTITNIQKMVSLEIELETVN